MVDVISELSATDCFDYFVNNFESLYKNESKYKANPILDSQISNSSLYDDLHDNYLNLVITEDNVNDYQITYSRGLDGFTDFINATFYDPTTDQEVVIEINRDETPESVQHSFKKGLQTIRAEYASSVYELKNRNHRN